MGLRCIMHVNAGEAGICTNKPSPFHRATHRLLPVFTLHKHRLNYCMLIPMEHCREHFITFVLLIICKTIKIHTQQSFVRNKYDKVINLSKYSTALTSKASVILSARTVAGYLNHHICQPFFAVLAPYAGSLFHHLADTSAKALSISQGSLNCLHVTQYIDFMDEIKAKKLVQINTKHLHFL